MPEATIRQRYRRSLRNFFALYRPLAHSWKVLDNTQTGQTTSVAYRNYQMEEAILDREVWSRMLRESDT